MAYSKMIREISAELGIKPHTAKYRMWHQVLHLDHTALVFDETVRGGGQRLIPLDEAPSNITKEYVLEAIRNHAFSLGAFNTATPRTKFTPWHARIETPSGYHAHMIGPKQ